MTTKQQVREYLARRVSEHRPPPSQEEIRRQLGFDLVPKPVDAPKR